MNRAGGGGRSSAASGAGSVQHTAVRVLVCADAAAASGLRFPYEPLAAENLAVGFADPAVQRVVALLDPEPALVPATVFGALAYSRSTVAVCTEERSLEAAWRDAGARMVAENQLEDVVEELQGAVVRPVLPAVAWLGQAPESGSGLAELLNALAHFEKFRVELLAERTVGSRRTLERWCAAHLGCTPSRLLTRYRMAVALVCLSTALGLTQDEAATCAGYFDGWSLSAAARRHGLTLPCRGTLDVESALRLLPPLVA